MVCSRAINAAWWLGSRRSMTETLAERFRRLLECGLDGATELLYGELLNCSRRASALRGNQQQAPLEPLDVTNEVLIKLRVPSAGDMRPFSRVLSWLERNPTGCLEAFLHTTVSHHALEIRRKRRREQPLEEPDKIVDPHPVDRTHEIKRAITRCLARLRASARRADCALALHLYLQSFTERQIHRLLRPSQGEAAFHNRLQFCIRLFRSCMQEEGF